MATNLAKGKVKASFVLPEKLVEKLKIRAIKEKVRNPSVMAERLLTAGLKSLPAAGSEPEHEPERAAS